VKRVTLEIMGSLDRASRLRRKRLLPLASGIVVIAVAVGIFAAPQTAFAVHIPSLAEVQAAKGHAAETKTQVAQITASLASLQKTASAKSLAAVQADAANTTAQSKLASATSTANALSTQLAAEKKKALIAHQEAGQLAANLSRVGNSTSLEGSIFDGKDAGSTLYKLGALSQLTAQWQTVLNEATVASKSVSSLSAQANVAQQERDKLATQAATTLASAQAAQQQADDAVSSASSQQQTLYARLAVLNSTTASLEKTYSQHQAALASYRAELVAKHNAEIAQYAKDHPAPVVQPVQASSPTPTGSGVVDDTAGAHAYAQSVLGNYGWSSDQYQCLVNLWNQESGWRTSALNVSSGAYGIPQALPADKMATAGLDWQTSYVTQINWGLGYIKASYGSPCGAWAHEVAHNWY
jgi:septal ring factor EnvC (AmiA/AmiB activator)